MNSLDKHKLESISAQLRLDLPNHPEDDRAKYIDLLEIMLEDSEIADLEVNGGQENFTRFIDKYADKLLAWKLQNN